MLYLLLYIGTEIIVKSFEVTEIGTDFLTLQWEVNGNYSGFLWEVSAQCHLQCESDFYTTLQSKVPKSQNKMTLSALKPSSKCYISLRARFISANFDPGLNLVSQTNTHSK